MCGNNLNINIRHWRLNRVSFKNYLAKRYKSKIADTIVSCFDFSMPWDYVNFFEGLEVFVNNPEDSLRKMIFTALDYNNDNYISEIDLFVLMRTLESYIFVNVASKDAIDIVNFLNQKKKDKGMDDPVENKMRKLEEEVQELRHKASKHNQSTEPKTGESNLNNK